MSFAKRVKLSLEQLEARLVPTFNYMFSPSSSTWTLTQVQDSGSVTVAVTANQLVVTEGAGTPHTPGPVGANLSISLLPNNDNLEVDLNSGLTGNLTLNLATGTRSVTLGGS